MATLLGRMGSVCVNEQGDLGLVTGHETKDMRRREVANGRILDAGPMRVAWTGVSVKDGKPWRGVNVRAATKDEIIGLG